MPSILRKIEEPQDIYIISALGCEVKNDECTIMGITDDYCTYDIITENGEELVHSESVGFVMIMTKSEFEAVAKRLASEDIFEEHSGLDCEDGKVALDDDKYAVILRNFSGTIQASLRDDEGKCYLNNYDVVKDCYIQYEGVDEDHPSGWLDPYLVVPDGTVAEHVHIFQVMDEVSGNTEWMNLSDLVDYNDFFKALLDIYTKYGDSWSTNYNLGKQFSSLFLNGFLLGYVDDKYLPYISETCDLFLTEDKPDFNRVMGYTTDISIKLSNLAQFIIRTDVYKKRINDFYKPLRRTKSKYELSENCSN